MKSLVRAFLAWLPLAVAVTGICLLVYGVVQQEYRQSLNDPQIQMAEDGAAALAAGAVPADLVQRGVAPIDAAKSLAPWIAVYDASGTPLESSAALDGAPPAPPKGEFALALAQGNNLPHNTWQTGSGVRIALVIVPVQGKNMFVAAGRNMSEVENRESMLGENVLLAWAVLILATFAFQLFAIYVSGAAD
jgi:hypothetical protein